MSPPAKADSQPSWLIFILLVLVQGSAVWSVHQAGWLTYPWLLSWVSLAALLTGLALARMRAPAEFLHIVSLLVGGAALGYAGASTLPEGSLYERLTVIIERIMKWIEVTREGGIGTDNLLFLLFLCSLAWLIGYAGAWALYRYQSAWLAVLGSGAALVVTVSYAEDLGHYFFLFAPAAILLFVAVHAGRQDRALAAAGIADRSRLRGTFLRQGAVAAVLVVAVSAWAPGVASNEAFVGLWQRVERPWLDLQSEFARLFGPIQPGISAGASSYSSTLALQGGVNLSDAWVLEVYTSQARRLRGVTYDRYTGQGWLTEERERVDVPANSVGLEPASADKGRQELTQRIRVLRTKGDLLFAASLPRQVDIPIRAEMETLLPGQGAADPADVYTDLGAIRAAVGPYRGQEYTVVSAVSKASAEALREAGTDYPQRTWQRYTALPRTVPMSVRNLARSLTLAHDNPYDKAVAVEAYLRGLTYSLDPPAPPQGRDIVEFFLFESGEGYCDYFSSAMVVLLRTVGIPARVAAGYLPGSWSEDDQSYIVRESDAHSWPEVYFPGYGWIEFEPTASVPGVARPETVAEEVSENDADLDLLISAGDYQFFDDEDDFGLLGPVGSDPESLSGQPMRREIPLGILLAAAIAAAVAKVTSYVWQRRFRSLRPAEATYAKMSDMAGLLGRGPRPQQTPFEYAETLARAVPAGAPAIQFIARAYVRLRFGPAQGRSDESGDLSAAWRSLRTLLPRGLVAWTVRRLGRRHGSRGV